MTSVLLILALMLFMAGCAMTVDQVKPQSSMRVFTSDSPPAGAETSSYVKVYGHTVFLPTGATSPLAEPIRRKIVRAIKAHVSAFQKQENVVCPAVTIVITSDTNFPAVKLYNALGCYYWQPYQIIYLFCGSYFELPACYHELGHLCFCPHDIYHKDPRWTAWNEREEEINKRLVDEGDPR